LDLLDSVRDEVKPIINGMGFKIVELKLGLSHNLCHISVVVYSRNGVGINDCSAISKNILPRLELIEELDNITLEVTSPGIDRQIKSKEEYYIFKNKGIKLLLDGDSEWTGGLISEMKENKLFLLKGKEIIEIDMDSIKKAKLDYTQEDR
jgi:ribosome maturation factor RimP